MTDTNTKLRILCIDDEEAILSALRRVFRKLDVDLTLESDSAQALGIIQKETFDIIISDMRMPQIDGATVLTQALLCQPRAIRILLTGFADQEATIRSINETQLFAYVQKPWDNNELIHIIEEAQRKLALEDEQRLLTRKLRVVNQKRKARELQQQENLEKLQVKLQQKTTALGQLDQQHNESLLTSITMLAQLSVARCGLSPKFIETCRLHCSTLARALELSAEQQYNLDLAAQLFLVGKIQLTDELARIPVQALSPDQHINFREFSQLGADYLMPLQELKGCALIISHFFERVDGKGFPNALTANEIPIECRILSMVSHFLHRIDHWSLGYQLSEDLAEEELLQLAGSQFDESLVNTYNKVLLILNKNKSSIPDIAVSLSQVIPDSTLSRDLTNSAGVLILAKSSLLTQSSIDHLLSFEHQRDEKLILHVWPDISKLNELLP
jgi:response regulator RpfG family c-di-GMP phosphodiesterase